jgi:hypothetical protein
MSWAAASGSLESRFDIRVTPSWMSDKPGQGWQTGVGRAGKSRRLRTGKAGETGGSIPPARTALRGARRHTVVVGMPRNAG